MAKTATIPLTNDQIERIINHYADGMKPSAISREVGISTFRVKGVLKRKEVADAVDRMRLTDTIPVKLDAVMAMMTALTTWLESTDGRLGAVDEELRKLRTAMRRLQVENKHLRETRKEARKQLREARAALWRARGY